MTETGLKIPGVGRIVIPDDVMAKEAALLAALCARLLIPRRHQNFSDVAEFIKVNKLDRFIAVIEVANGNMQIS